MSPFPAESATAADAEAQAQAARDARFLDQEAEHLHFRFPEAGTAEHVREVLGEAYRELAETTRHPNMLVPTALNLATQRLREGAKDQGSVESRHPRVLFVCHGNAGRSQMASALLANRSEGRIPARSSGTTPAASVLPTALESMAEVGIPLHRAVPKSVDMDIAKDADVVVLFDGAEPLDWPAGPDVRRWPVPSITGMNLEQVRAVRDDLDGRVRELISELEG